MMEQLSGKNELVVVDGVDHFFAGRIEELGNAITRWAGGSSLLPKQD